MGMDTLQGTRASFGLENFGTAGLGDRRRTERLVKTADRIFQHPGGTLPEKLQDPADLKGTYRLVDAEEVTHAAVLRPHQELTRRRMQEHGGDILILHDTTELDYTGKRSLKALGQIGNGSHRGYLCHNSLAVAADSREVLGLVNQILYCRPKVPARETRSQRRAKADRESRLWKQGSEAVGVPPAGSRWVDICDRGADLFEYLDYKHASGGWYVVRSRHDRGKVRPVGGDGSYQPLHACARALPKLGHKTIAVPAREGQVARTARVRVGAGAVEVSPPRNPRGEHRDEVLTLWVVYIGEEDVPAGAEPVEWILLTNVPTVLFVEACQRSEWYSCRWIIEEYHKAQKTGCGIELPQFTSEGRLEPMIALLSVTAVELLRLRTASRQPDAQVKPAREVMPETYVAVLSAWRYGEVRIDLTVHDFFYALARLGGHQNRKNDRPPGWLVLWRGWTTLQAMVAGVAVMEGKRCG